MNTPQSDRVSASVSPGTSMQILSRREIEQLYDASQTKIYSMFRQCALAVLNSGSSEDDTNKVLDQYKTFDIQIVQRERGIKLELTDAPGHAFVDGEMIKGIKEHLFSVLRDIVFIHSELYTNNTYDLSTSRGTTDAVFNILRHANALQANKDPDLIVCWGGHSIDRHEYDYTKLVGYQLGLRYLNICTGCGPGAMKGPMKGAAISHSKQRYSQGRYLGISEPGIIAAESPNPIVNELIIMPDIEKRLEAFVRTGHGIIVFPGGVGTAEEIFYLLGVLLHPNNDSHHIPLIFTAPAESASYFDAIDAFIGLTLGPDAQSKYQIVIDDPTQVARSLANGMDRVRVQRRENKDAFFFNWTISIPNEFQQPFIPSHKNMAALNLNRDQSPFDMAVNLRAMFSGLVAGNVKAEGLQAIAEYGNYKINGDATLMTSIDELLVSFAKQGRMKINADAYSPCYEITNEL